MPIDLNMPQLGESVVEGTILKWLVREGDVVTREQSIVEVATDKADTEVPAPTGGLIVKLLAAEGDTVKIGAALCQIEPGVTAAAAPSAPSADPAPQAAKAASPAPAAASTGAPAAAPSPVGPHLSPSARKAAREQGLDPAQVATSRAAFATAPGSVLPPGITLPQPNIGYGSYKVPAYRPQPGDEVVAYTRRRRLTADHMVYSKLTAPHVVTVAEVDLHRAMKLREAHKDRYKKDGSSLTVLAFVCAATTKALREHPTMNARVLDDAYVVLRNINLGVAVDAPDGLIVPNIKKADELSIRGMTKAIDDVAKRARAGKITADDLAGCSFSISNPGLKGNLFGGAILSQPNVGILRMGEIQKRAVVVEVGGEDAIVVHPVMHLALSYDHRIVDGALANAFLWRVTELLELAEFEV